MFYLVLISKSQKANECSSGHFNWLINMNIFINKILTFFFLFFCYVETNKCILLDWDAKKARCSEELLLINYHNFLTEFFKVYFIHQLLSAEILVVSGFFFPIFSFFPKTTSEVSEKYAQITSILKPLTRHVGPRP